MRAYTNEILIEHIPLFLFNWNFLSGFGIFEV